VLNGKKECEIQQLLTDHGKSNPHKGAQRFISCHETNVPAKDDPKWQEDSEDPLWVLMENGGDSSLLQWIRSDQWKADLVQPLFKQLLEGLSFLASMSPPYTHHDLKPDNCVIKQTRDGKLLLNIIDFGGAAKVTPESRFVPPAPTLGSTRGFFPWEYGAKITVSNDCPPPDSTVPPPDSTVMQNFAACPVDHCGSLCGLSFDIFAVGQIWFNMILGDPSDEWGYGIFKTDTIEVSGVIAGFENTMKSLPAAQQKEWQYDKFNGIVDELKGGDLALKQLST